MTAAFLAGAVAGYAIAIPVGAIAVLIVETAMRRGFRVGAGAGLGAATADGIFATLAAIGGLALAGAIEPIERLLRVLGVGVLLGLGLRGLLALARRDGDPAAARVGTTGPIGTWLRFSGLTLLNPQTVIYFAALIVGLPAIGSGPAERATFVLGAFLASASWQLVLAAVGAFAHYRLGPRFRLAVGVLGNLVICAFGIALAASLGDP